MGYPVKDPMMAVGGAIKVAGIVAAKEIDIMKYFKGYGTMN